MVVDLLVVAGLDDDEAPSLVPESLPGRPSAGWDLPCSAG